MLLAALLLQANLPTVHPVLLALFGAALTALATWLWKLRDEARAARAAAEQNRVTAEQALREEIKTVREALKTEVANRTEWQLKREGEMAKVADILEESAEAHRLLASLAARADGQDGRLNRHDSELLELGRRIEAMHGHIHQLSVPAHAAARK